MGLWLQLLVRVIMTDTTIVMAQGISMLTRALRNVLVHEGEEVQEVMSLTWSAAARSGTTGWGNGEL